MVCVRARESHCFVRNLRFSLIHLSHFALSLGQAPHLGSCLCDGAKFFMKIGKVDRQIDFGINTNIQYAQNHIWAFNSLIGAGRNDYISNTHKWIHFRHPLRKEPIAIVLKEPIKTNPRVITPEEDRLRVLLPLQRG